MSTYADASLIYYPSGYKESKAYSLKPTDGSGDLTFTRASTATRVNEQGLIEEASILGSELIDNGDFANGLTDWTENGGSYATIVSGALNSNNPDAGNWFAENISQNVSFVNGTTYKLTFKAKNISGNLNLRITQNANPMVSLDLTSAFVDYTFFYTANANNGSIRIFCNSAVGQFQIDDISVKEVTRNNVPRIDYTGGGCGKLLLEPQRSNLVLRSEEFDNVAWFKENVAITPNAIASPSGLIDADMLVENSSNAFHAFRNTSAISATVAVHTFSIFLKTAGRRYANLSYNTNGSSYVNGFIVDLQDGVITQTVGTFSVAPSVQNYGNGWFRVSYGAALDGGSFVYVNGAVSSNSLTTAGRAIYIGSGSSSFYVWGADLQLGNFQTSYIPTTTTAVTRVADSASKSGISSLINSPEGSFYVEAKALFNGGTFRSFSLTDGTEPNRITFNWSSNASVFLLFVKLGGTLIVNNSTSAFTQTDNNKILLKWGGGTYKLFINGVLKTTLTGLAMPSASLFDRLTFDASYTPFEGRVQGVMIFPNQVSDTDAIALTTL